MANPYPQHEGGPPTSSYGQAARLGDGIGTPHPGNAGRAVGSISDSSRTAVGVGRTGDGGGRPALVGCGVAGSVSENDPTLTSRVLSDDSVELVSQKGTLGTAVGRTEGGREPVESRGVKLSGRRQH